MTENKTIRPLYAIAQIREGVRINRAAKRQAAALEAELASYRTPSERAELDAIFSRANADDVAALQPILDRLHAA